MIQKIKDVFLDKLKVFSGYISESLKDMQWCFKQVSFRQVLFNVLFYPIVLILAIIFTFISVIIMAALELKGLFTKKGKQ